MLLEGGIVVTLVGWGLAGAGVGFRGAWTAVLLLVTRVCPLEKIHPVL